MKNKEAGTLAFSIVLAIIFSGFSVSRVTAQDQVSNDQRAIADFQSMPALQWKFKSKQPFIAAPVINEGIVYVGGLDSNFYALDANQGNIKWKFRTYGPIRSTACINGNQLYFFSGDGNLYCLDKSSGKTAWTFKTKGDHQYDIYDYHQSSPVLYNGNIYFGSGDGNVYSVNAADGKQVWNFKTGDVVHSTPAIGDNKLFVGSFDGFVYALKVQDGSFIWKFKTVGHNYFPKGEVQFSPTIANGMVYIGARDYNLYALDMNTGVCHWNREFPAGWVPVITPSYKNDSIIYVGTSDPLLLLAINGVTENTIWKTDLKSEEFGRCVLSQNMGYAGTLAGKFYGVDLKTGKIQWTFSTDGYNANHLKYFKPDDTFRDDIFSILKTNEDFLNAMFTLGSIYSAAAISKDVIILSSTDGTVYCLKRSS